MINKSFFPLAGSQDNLRRLLAIRAIVIAFQALGIAYAWHILELSLNYFLLCSLLILWITINVGVYLRLLSNWLVSDLEFLAHLLLDVLSLSLLLYFSGGANNPFVSYLLVPVTISAAILPWSYTWFITGTSILSYSFLLFFYKDFPELMPMDMAMEESGIPSLHVIGMWFNFLVSAALITYFVVKMANEIRAQAEKLSSYREENLRDEQILAVATQAAGTAHELGTPLATMAILLGEMEQDYTANAELKKDISLLKQQISRCKQSLKELVNQADVKNGSNAKMGELKSFIKAILEQWQLLRPEVKINFIDVGRGVVPKIIFESTLQQSIVNILNNAADASPDGIDVTLDYSNEQWVLQIRDYGDGMSEEAISQLGLKVRSTKENGLGVGLVLSHASINRLGGKVKIYHHEESGLVTKITLPIDINGADSKHE